MRPADGFRWSADAEGEWLCIRTPAARNILENLEPGKKYDFDVQIHREKRSLDANAYYWKLCGELARKTHAKPQEIYRRHIKDLGNYAIYCMETKAVEEFSRLWTSGHLGRFIETRESRLPGCTTVLAYYGSSDFDRTEMATLIDNCIQDCKAIGIETLPPEKLEAMKEAWR